MTNPIIDSTLGGVALLDYDNDGYLDIFSPMAPAFLAWTRAIADFLTGIYHNNHDGTFTDVTERAGVAGEGYSMGAAAADYDNDGWTDLYVTGVNRKYLVPETITTGRSPRNAEGWSDRRFRQQEAVVGISSMDRLRQRWAADLFVANYLDWSPENSRVCGSARQTAFLPAVHVQGEPTSCTTITVTGRFTDVSAASGIANSIGKGDGRRYCRL